MDATQNVLNLFEQISAVPRGSGREAALSRWLQERADAHGFLWKADEAGNLVIRPGFCGDPWPAHRTCLGASVLLVDAQVVDFQLRRNRLIGEGQAPASLPVVVDHHVQNDLHRPVFDRR